MPDALCSIQTFINKTVHFGNMDSTEGADLKHCLYSFVKVGFKVTVRHLVEAWALNGALSIVSMEVELGKRWDMISE